MVVVVSVFVALSCAAAAVSLQHGRALDPGNRVARQWLTSAFAVAALLFTATALVSGLGLGSPAWAVVCSAGTLVAGACAYAGLLRLHRRTSVTARAADWSNGVSALLALVGLGDAVAARLVAEADWLAQSWVVQAAVWAVVLGTATSLLGLTGLGRRPGAWIAVVGLWTLVAVQLSSLVAAINNPSVLALEVERGPVMPLVWAGCAAAVVVATRRPAPVLMRDVTPGSAAGGAMLIVGSSLAIVVADAAVGGGPTAATVVSCAVAGAIGLIRLGTMVKGLAELAASRVEARTDLLTGLANRRGLLEVLDRACGAPTGAGLAVLDMDGFKEVNDTLGHAGGDEYIATLAVRLRDAVPPDVVVARIGGDGFGAVVPSPGDVDQVASDLLAAARQPVAVHGRSMVLEASAGVAVSGSDPLEAEEVMRRADAAMYVAKRSGGGLRAYDEQLDTLARGRLVLARELRAILTGGSTLHGHGELVVYYQPQIDIATGAVHGAEALVRWQHPRLGLLAPGAFLPLIEEHRLTMELTTRILSLATVDAAAWPDGLAVSVNVSGPDLAHPDAVATVEEALDAAGLDAQRLTIELTETMLTREPAASSAIMRRLRPLGVRFSLDDYGTGYSTLALLRDLPVDELKIDRSFVGQLTADERTRAIVAGTIQVAHSLGMTVVGEGVEDDLTLAALHTMGCDLSQGYLHATPLPEPVFRAWSARQSARVERLR